MPGGQKSAGRRPRKEQRPEGEKKCFKQKARAAGPGKNNVWRAEKLGPQAQREQNTRRAKKTLSKNGPGRRPIKTFQKKQRSNGQKKMFSVK